MYRSFSPNLVRPNLPLRKPSSSPVMLSALSSARHDTPVRPPAGAIVDGPMISPVSNNAPGILGSMPPALTVYFCNYCGQQGNFRCKRCKKTPYCSVLCQTEDWNAHRHMCKSVDPEPAKDKPKETASSPVTGVNAPLPDAQHGDAPRLQRVYLKDLHMAKTIKGADIQATVVEFYSPSRFFLLVQSPELLEALKSISQELQKTYSCPSVTTYAPSVGEVCAVQFSCDMNWYRGLVQTLTADRKMAKILYIDFGNEEDVPVERIKPLADNIQLFCPCAMECRVVGIVPVAGSWSGECCMAVRQMLAGKTMTARLGETLEGGRIHLADILLSTHGKQLSAFLVEHNYAQVETVNAAPTEQEINAMMSASLENFRCLSDGKDDNSWAQPPQPLTQAVGDSFSVVVTHIQSPKEIIVQKVENAGVIQELQLKLREYCSKISAPKNFRPAPGTVCCAQFSEDKQWYRAKVLAYSSEERVCVGYLDFGNSEEVDLGHLRPISSPLLALPMQAMPCGLAGVHPMGESWSEDCLLALQRRVSNRILRIEIQGAHEGKALVAMIDEASDPQANLAELLTAAGFAAPAAANASNDQQTAQPQVVTPVLVPACEPLVWSCTELPCNGQTVALLASVMEHPQEFYCRINNPTDHQRLIDMGTKLKQHCEVNSSPFVPKVGEPCCAKFLGDGAWYRAMVNSISEDEVSVNFVDYGSCMKVEKKDLRSITPQLLTLPFQAIHCWLAGVEPLGSEWSSEALLWFQKLVDSENLSARVVSVTEQGYGVDLESRGQNVAAALISCQLAKAPGASPNVDTCPVAKPQEKIKESENKQMNAQDSNQAGTISKVIPTGQNAALPAPSFPADWKTMELPLNETFQPFIAAVVSPSLFYLLGRSQVDQQKLQEVMMELAAYCTTNPASLSGQSRAAAGAACCAQFSADNNWYRAVVLEVTEKELAVIYADYGNTEKVPFSRILPIPTHLLQLPFQITRCTLTGKEHFPAEWPEEVLQMFHGVLLDGVLATVQSFDGSANVLSVTLPTERGGGHLTTMILDSLQAQAKSKSSTPTPQGAGQTDSSTPPTASTTAVPVSPKPMSKPETPKKQGTPETLAPEPVIRPPQQKTSPPAVPVIDHVQKIIEQMEPSCKPETKTNDFLSSGCCCSSLKTKVEQLESLMQLQISLTRQLLGQIK